MSEFLPNPAVHVARETLRRVGVAPAGGALSRRPKETPLTADVSRGLRQLRHPLPFYTMWRGNTTAYSYNSTFLARWGEGETKHRYHQYFAHAKDPADYDKPGSDYELLQVRRGKLLAKPLPAVQYVSASAKPAWNFRSWADLLATLDPWQRELQYPEHVPEHLGAKRPLCPLAPAAYHRHVHLAYMERIDVTVCPLFFGFGPSIQRTALEFYRRCLSARSLLPKDRVHLHYSVEYVSPKIVVTWVDGTTFSPPLFEGGTAQSIIQRVMEQAFLQRDRLEASGKQLQPLTIDDYKWNEVIKFKKEKKAAASKKK
jgi:hypothetical protein